MFYCCLKLVIPSFQCFIHQVILSQFEDLIKRALQREIIPEPEKDFLHGNSFSVELFLCHQVS
jgi:hypothetical protein